MAETKLAPLSTQVPIVDENGNPTPYFQQLMQIFIDEKNAAVDDIDATIDDVVDLAAEVATKQDQDALLDSIAALSDPGSDKMLFWDDSAGQLGWLEPADNLAIDGTDLDATTSGGGGGFFSGISAGPQPATSGAFATKGMVFVPTVDVEVHFITINVDAAASTDSYYGIIASLASITTANHNEISAVGNTVAIIGSTNAYQTGSTNNRPHRCDFASPVTLTAGTPYFIGAVFNQGSGTAVNRITGNTISTEGYMYMNAPGKTYVGLVSYNTVGLTTSQAASSVTANAYVMLGIEGYVA